MKCITLIVLTLLYSVALASEDTLIWSDIIKYPNNLSEMKSQLDREFGSDALSIKDIVRGMAVTLIHEVPFDRRTMWYKATRYVEVRYCGDNTDRIDKIYKGSLIKGKIDRRVNGKDLLLFWAGVSRIENGQQLEFNDKYTLPLMSDQVAPIQIIDVFSEQAK